MKFLFEIELSRTALHCDGLYVNTYNTRLVQNLYVEAIHEAAAWDLAEAYVKELNKTSRTRKNRKEDPDTWTDGYTKADASYRFSVGDSIALTKKQVRAIP